MTIVAVRSTEVNRRVVAFRLISDEGKVLVESTRLRDVRRAFTIRSK